MINFPWENIVVSLSNLVGLYTLNVCNIYNRPRREFWSILVAVTASICYHMVEQEKHGFRGLGVELYLPELQYLFLCIDRFAAMIAIIVFLPEIKDNWDVFSTDTFFFMISGMISMILSEIWVLGIPYIILHSYWHFCAFHTAACIIIDIETQPQLQLYLYP